ncbi:hypothetical protein [Oceanobacillus kimchii]|uniref:Uncharacterized protein n=1 Tax=Oceanobacillus kimchii TaxID=746691 RepID=A0ABQ5TKP9_9BACI|nr:hypothetical protein [Oceanobacillus kimchii]GLO66208.1 hypothetical protein MACH08_19920 [Oceanobacillus kimchii]
MRKIILWTNKTGLEQFENGEIFYAKSEKDYRNIFPFYVSPENILGNIGGVLAIDTGSDADFS